MGLKLQAVLENLKAPKSPLITKIKQDQPFATCITTNLMCWSIREVTQSNRILHC